jgi:hypothetical protein
VGVGILVTAGVGIATEVVLPYGFGNFYLIDVGTLSTISALAAIAYATCSLSLFNTRAVIRAALVVALLTAFAMELYQAAVSAIHHLREAEHIKDVHKDRYVCGDQNFRNRLQAVEDDAKGSPVATEIFNRLAAMESQQMRQGDLHR